MCLPDVKTSIGSLVMSAKSSADTPGRVLDVHDREVDVLPPDDFLEKRKRLAAGLADNVSDEEELHFAKSTALVSRMTVIFICPGYWSSASMRLARSFDIQRHSSSVTFFASTMTRSSRPAWIANVRSTPFMPSVIFSSFSRRLT